MGRLEAYRDIEQYLRSILPQIPRYESPQYTKQALSHVQARIAALHQSPVVAPSTKDNVEKVKEVADELRRKRGGQ